MQGRQNTELAKAFDTEDAPYWIGMLLSDGNVYIPPKGNPEIALTLLDKEHVEKFREFVGHWNPLYHTKWNTWRYRFNSKEAAEVLEGYGVVPRKSLTAEVASSMKSNPHFWRGMIDGDGCIYCKGKCFQLQLVGSRDVCESFLAYANSFCPSKAKVSQRGNYFVVRITKREAIKELLEAMYCIPGVSLDRKARKAKEVLSCLSSLK